VSVYEEIFPAERHLDYVQTEWSNGWTAGASGFGYAAELSCAGKGKSLEVMPD
jgi:hypothetical protein